MCLVCVAFTFAGCDSDDSNTDPTSDGDATADTSGATQCAGAASTFSLKPSATGGAKADKPAFTDITADTNLPALGVTGVRVNAVDIDRDGLADLVVRNQNPGKRDSFAAGGARYTWLLRNKGGFQFEDITQSSGFVTPREGGDEGRTVQVTVWGDVDNDGDLDAFQGVALDLNNDNGDRSELLLNDGTGKFTLASATPILADTTEKWPVFGAAFLDYNRDGRLDLFVGHPWTTDETLPDQLFEGDGAGGLRDVSKLRGFGSIEPTVETLNESLADHNTWGVTACDLNGDGWPELMASVYGRGLNGLWVGDETGFTNRSTRSKYASDQRTDWTTNLNAQCYCSLNPTAEGCAGVQAPAQISCDGTLRWNHDSDREPYRLGGNSFSTVCGDIDNDGDMDLFDFQIVHWDVGDTSDPSEPLFNQGPVSAVDSTPVFERPGNAALGLARAWKIPDWNAGDLTGALFDFDNDGRKDALIVSSDYPGTYAALFWQKPDGTFQEVPTAFGIDMKRAQGVGIADIDRDGDLDVVLGHSRARCDAECLPTAEVHIFRNDVGQDGKWFQVELVGGDGSNRAAIGAQVRIKTASGVQMSEVNGGHGHVGIQHDLVQHFGLGPDCVIDELRVRWPDQAGTEEVFTAVEVNRRVRITQGTGQIEAIP
jgi:enediyne biosynthesis protein E4